MSENHKDISLRASLTNNVYVGGPFDESYFSTQGKDGERYSGGYTNYADFGDSTQPISVVITNRADDIEAQTGSVSGKNILVIGCAFGYLVNELASRGADVLGLDISSYAISQAETLFPALDFTTQDVVTTNLKKNDYDLIIGNHIIQCMPDGVTLDLLLQESYRLVSPAGKYYGLEDETPQYYYVISDSDLLIKYDNWFGSGVAVITDTGHLPLSADRRIVVG